MILSRRVGLSLLLFTSIFFSGCAENPADRVPVAVVKSPAASGEVSSTQSGTATSVFSLDEQTEVRFVGSKITGSHEGGFKNVTGSVALVDGDLSQASVDVKIDMTSLFSDDKKLTVHLKGEDFFAVDSFQNASFKSSQIVKDENVFMVTGALTLRGVTKNIEFPANMALANDKFTASAEFAIKRKDFGIEYPGRPDDLIRDEVVIKFDLTASLKKA